MRSMTDGILRAKPPGARLCRARAIGTGTLNPARALER
jgi:hypothetical protein